MVEDGEVDHLVPERVWQELSRGLMSSQPSRMFRVLRECGALARLLPEIDRLFGVPQPPAHHPEIDTGIHVMLVVDWASRQAYSLPVRFAALTHDLGKGLTPESLWPKHHGHEAKSVALVKEISERLRVPADCRDLALLVARYHGDIHRALELRPETILKILESTDAFRRPERFVEILQACESDFRGRPGYEQRDYPASDFFYRALALASGINAAAIAEENSGNEKSAINKARLFAIKSGLTFNQ
jgi:tRNA nucleotidyltransferase (CCA-adding enzyme)